MMKHIFSLLFLSLLSISAQAAIKGEEVSYKVGDATMKGYLAYDDATTAKRPGILVVHEWWGHNEYARKRARMLAEMGYTALAVDMYGDGKTAAHPDDAGKFATEANSNPDERRARFVAAQTLLENHPSVAKNATAAIGYCFGGGVVLNMAREGLGLKGVASFHGSLSTNNPAQSGKIKARVLVLNGEDDPMAPAQTVADFKKEMDSAGVNYKFVNYPGVKHSFTNPEADKFGAQFNMPLAYNAEADKASWSELDKFLKSIFKK
jgi:dienelactone hydrolase